MLDRSKFSKVNIMFDRSLYDEDQLVVLVDGLGDDPTYGDISDIDPRTHSAVVLEVYSLSRGKNPMYGSIEEFINIPMTASSLRCCSQGRSSVNTMFGNIDDIIHTVLNSTSLIMYSLGRGSEVEYGNIDDLLGKGLNSVDLLRASLSRGASGECKVCHSTTHSLVQTVQLSTLQSH